MPPSMIFDRFETAVVPFPFTDVPISKRRPALVVSGRSFNKTNGATILAMITTAKESHWPSDLAIEVLAAAGLNVACIVRWKLFTLPNTLILRRLGLFSAIDRERSERAVTAIFQ